MKKYVNGALVDLTQEEIQALQPSLATVIQNKLTKLAAYRYEKEIAGITINGATISTDRDSQAKVSGAYNYVQIAPAAIINWKGENGWVQLDAATITAIAQAVGAHVQVCFDNEKTHSDAIQALTTVAAVEAYDFTVGW